MEPSKLSQGRPRRRERPSPAPSTLTTSSLKPDSSGPQSPTTTSVSAPVPSPTGAAMTRGPKSKAVAPRVVADTTDLSRTVLSRKGSASLNHLLDFRFESHSHQPQPQHHRRHHEPHHGHHGSASTRPKVVARSRSVIHSREQFVNANCRFIVRGDGQYLPLLADPDSLVPWTSIEEIIFFSPDLLVCPICLGPPVAAQITRCGHVYCWPCILHHLANSDKAWNFCPLCEDYVYSKDLRSVTVKLAEKAAVSERRRFRLMRRHKTSTLAVPRVHFASIDASIDPLLAAADRSAFRISPLESNEDLERILLREERQLLGSDSDPDDPFVKRAITSLHQRRKDARPVVPVVALDPSAAKPEPESDEDVPRTYVWAKSHSPPKVDPDVLSVFGNDSEVPDIQLSSLSSSELEVPEASTPQTPTAPALLYEDDTVYFYQAESGAPIFLHSINQRCLREELRDYSRFPDELIAEVVDVETVTVDEDIRHRYRHLSHLPLGCEIMVCELDLSEYLSPSTMEKLSDVLSRRRQERRRKVQEERRLDRKAKEYQQRLDQEFAMMLRGQHGGVLVQPEPPDLQDEFFAPMPSGSPGTDSDLNVGTPPSVSFAKAVASGIMSSVEENPPLSVAMTVPRGASASRAKGNPWGPKSPSSVELAAAQSSPVDQKMPPSFRDSFRDALDAAIPDDLDASSKASSEGKKGRKKGRLLFSTSLRGGF